MIVPEQAQAELTIQGVIDVLVQLNEDQAYSYDRAALLRMVDDAATKTRGPLFTVDTGAPDATPR